MEILCDGNSVRWRGRSGWDCTSPASCIELQPNLAHHRPIALYLPRIFPFYPYCHFSTNWDANWAQLNSCMIVSSALMLWPFVPWPGQAGVPQVCPGLEAAISILLCPPTMCTTLISVYHTYVCTTLMFAPHLCLHHTYVCTTHSSYACIICWRRA